MPPVDDASSATLIPLVSVSSNLYFYHARYQSWKRDTNGYNYARINWLRHFFRDRLFARYFVRFIRFINLFFYIPISFFYIHEIISKAFSALVNTIHVRLIQFVCYVRSRRGLISSVGFERLPHCYWQTTSRRVWNASYGEWIPSQSSLMSVSTGKVMLLKARFNLSSALLLLALSRFLFSESEMILFPASGVSSKFVQIYLLTFLQNTARLTKRIPSRWLFIVLFLTWIERTSATTAGITLYFAIRGAVKLAENRYDYSSRNT